MTITEHFKERFGYAATEELLSGLGRHWDESFLVKKADPDVRIICALMELYAWECSTKCKHRPKLSEKDIVKFLLESKKDWKLKVPMVGIHAWGAGRFGFLSEGT